MYNPTIKPTIKQQLAWKELMPNNMEARVIGFGGGAGGGKTWLGCEWLIVMAYMFPRSRWFIGREELTRLKKSTFITFGKVTRFHKIPESDWSLDSMNSVIKFTNGSTIDLIDVAYKPSDPNFERFGSLEYTGGFGEEAGEWHFDAFDVLKSRVGRHNTFDKLSNSMCEKPMDYDTNPEAYPNIQEIPPKMLLTFNPSKNWLYRIFYTPWRDGLLMKGYRFIQTLYTDNPFTSKMYGEQLDGIHNKVNKARLMYGDWEYTDDITNMTTFEALQDMFSNVIEVPKESKERYIVCDIARSGEDSTVYTIWQGLQVEKIIKKTKQTLDITTQDIKDLSSMYKIPRKNIIIDVQNVGAGVVDNLKGCVAFNSNNSPFLTKTEIREDKKRLPTDLTPRLKTTYANLKTQCAFKLAELINDRKISTMLVGEERDEIIEDISATLQERDIDKEGKKKIDTKEDIKEALGRSPDVGDTFIMRMYAELKKDMSDIDPMELEEYLQKQKNRMRGIQKSQSTNGR